MPSKAKLMRLARASQGIPLPAALPDAEILECNVIRSTPRDWKWAQNYLRKHENPNRVPRWRREGRRVLKSYCGKSLIFACIMNDRSVYSLYINPRSKAVVYWRETKTYRSGRTFTRYCVPGRKSSMATDRELQLPLAGNTAGNPRRRNSPGRHAESGEYRFAV
jgi:hypothetical protein